MKTVEMDDAWFDDRHSAIEHAYELVHTQIISERERLSDYRK